MLLCECAKRNAVIVRRMQSPDYFHRAVFKVHARAMPAGSSRELSLVTTGAEEGSTAARGHCERLECLTGELPPPRIGWAEAEFI